MATVSNVPELVDKKEDGHFQPKTAKGANKEAQWFSDERRVVNQDQRLKSIIILCLPDDIIESVISCETVKDTWTNLVHNFEGPSNTKENRNIGLKLEYNTFRAKPFESLSPIYTRYKTLLNELSNDGSLQQVQSSQNELKIQKDYKTEYKKEEVFNDEEMIQVKVLMGLAGDELAVEKNHARNGEWIDITMRKVSANVVNRYISGRISLLVVHDTPGNEALHLNHYAGVWQRHPLGQLLVIIDISLGLGVISCV
ncbi:hypothetical protein Tco_1541710 [Tanacetum coccineum]